MSLFVDDDDDVNLYEDRPIAGDSEVGDIPVANYQQSVEKQGPEPTKINGPKYDIPINLNLQLNYQYEIIQDLLAKDGLLILGRGLGWEIIVANILYILNLSNQKDKLPNPPQNRKSLLVLLNSNEHENQQLCRELGNLDTEMSIITGETMVADKRRMIYDKGGVVAVTSRILVVDLLSEILKPQEINGFFILHAENVRETSNESFIVNLYRDGNDWGCIKAFSDDPELFTGFTPLATRLRNLKLDNTFLWPRFHVAVSESISFRGKRYVKELKQVTEIQLKLTYKMTRIQSALLTCLDECLKELTRHNQTLATEYWDMENVYDETFVNRIRLSLESQWHRVSLTTKQLVGDLAFLKMLLQSLLTQDCVTFYQLVQSAVDSNLRPSKSLHASSMSPWLNSDVAPTIISYARERALGIHNKEYILEALPKWEELETLIKSIGLGNRILVMSSKSSGEILHPFLHNFRYRQQFGIRRYLTGRINDYVTWKEISKFSRLLSNAINSDQTEEPNMSKTFIRDREVHSKRRRTRGAASVANVNKIYASSGDKNPEPIDVDAEVLHNGSEDFNLDPEPEFVPIKREDPDSIVIDDTTYDISSHFYGSNDESTVLQTYSPTHIILYEPDLTFIRRVENYQALNQTNPALIYMMYYKDSTEEHEYLTHMKKEKEAFTKLIREKANLGKHFETKEDSKFQITKQNVVNTRIAGGQQFQTEDDDFRVIVDVREFRSSLPNLLYRVGCKVIPCTLTVGDYVLTPKICVERKAIPDLISSFKTGRLYNQCEQMFRHYEFPVLLIEFDESKSFSFEPFTEHRHQRNMNPITSKAVQDDIQNKLTMLLVSFPKLKIVWSSSPYETAQTFLELKAGEPAPDITSAINKGLSNGLHSLVNEDALDILTTIPGINNSNVYSIINKAKNMEELVDLSKDDLVDLLGKENGIKAFNFINLDITI